MVNSNRRTPERRDLNTDHQNYHCSRLCLAIMQSTHPLQTFLQLHLASDASAVSNLQYVTSSLTTELLVPSPHLGKWAARIQSLLRAKDSGPRWAGLCLALQTARLSRDYLLENSQSWCAYALPLLLVILNCSQILIHVCSNFSIERAQSSSYKSSYTSFDYGIPIATWRRAYTTTRYS